MKRCRKSTRRVPRRAAASDGPIASQPLSERIRFLVRDVEASKRCPTCGHRRTQRELADGIGISIPTLVKVLRGDVVRSSVMDVCEAWLRNRAALGKGS